ncbi:hypothetical protein N136_01556 [Leifsonia aquatica ATCC 14665]|uniref:Uncharacterized protein n=1 Tax=Leifsonia aquatica ATCC 14665 TaxID=1358026 RepID=U2TBM0_LEIAQ|nr:hypothetical protein N136_01556 [Leifsonia aquatica ATCC 14665]
MCADVVREVSGARDRFPAARGSRRGGRSACGPRRLRRPRCGVRHPPRSPSARWSAGRCGRRRGRAFQPWCSSGRSDSTIPRHGPPDNP